MVCICLTCQKVYGVTDDDLQRLVSNAQATETVEECSIAQSLKQSADRATQDGMDDNEKCSTSDQPGSISVHDMTHSTMKNNETLSEDKSQAMRNEDAVSFKSGDASLQHCVQPDPKRAKLSDSPPPASKSSQVCAVCLGLLSEAFFETLVNSIVDKLTHAQYVGLETFSLAIHAPLSLLIRQVGIKLFAQKVNGSDKAFADEHYVKEELREMLKVSLQKKLPPLIFNADSPFQITVYLDNESTISDSKQLKKIKPDAFPKSKRRYRKKSADQPSVTNVSVSKALEGITLEDFMNNSSLLSSVDHECSLEVKFHHRSLYVAGRYNKYSRHLPQTPWVVDGIKKAETSVQELISPHLLKLTRAESDKFSASGREDVDVRMLGNGRPFVIELVNPHKVVITQEELNQVSDVINKSTDLVAVRQLKLINKESLNKIKEGEEEKRKHYCALIWIEKEITPVDIQQLTEMKDLKIAQKTPIRVLHRRTLATRERIVYSMETKFVDRHHFKLYLCTQAGTYIKEFVHGDFGRTKPNLGTLLGKHVDILTLDVENIELEWPPVAA